MVAEPIAIPVFDRGGLARAKVAARKLAHDLGFSAEDVARIEVAVSELALNLITHAGDGTIALTRVLDGSQQGIDVRCEDQGPGIADVAAALKSAGRGKGLGIGLAGVCNLMDGFEIESLPGQGTRIRAWKWVNRR
ncbi:MAG: anti-sigma regulatory factor [Chloroflexi bacterium]|nr:anti-sigma regulatory factor [Chloroflexota bacterium]